MFKSLKARVIFSTVTIVVASVMILTVVYSEQARQQVYDALESDALKNINFTKGYIENEYNSIANFETLMEDREKEQMKVATDFVKMRIDGIYDLHSRGYLKEEEVKASIYEALDELNGNGFNAFWIQRDNEIVYCAKQDNFDFAVLSNEPTVKLTDYVTLEMRSNEPIYVDYFDMSHASPVKKSAYIVPYRHFNWSIGNSTEKEDPSIRYQALKSLSIANLQSLSESKIENHSYFFIFDSQSNMIVHHALGGQTVDHIMNPLSGQPLMQELMSVADFEGASLDYLWTRYDGDTYNHRKRAYVTYFEPYDWYIVSTFYLEDSQAKIKDTMIYIISLSLMLIGISSFVSFRVSKSLTLPLSQLVYQIRNIDERDGSEWIDVSGSNEIELLADSMNHMITSIKTSRQELLEAHLQVQSIMDSSIKMAIVSTDSEGIIQSFNVGAEKLLGYDSNDVIGKKTPLLYHKSNEIKKRTNAYEKKYQEKISPFQAITYVADSTGFEDREWTFIHKDGRQIPVHLIVTTILDANDEIVGYLGLANDITIRKETDEKLKKRSHDLRKVNKKLVESEEHLEAMVKKRTEELEISLATIQETQEQLIEAEKMALLGSLVAGVAHEINTPIGIGVTLSSSLSEKSRIIKEKLDKEELTKTDLIDYLGTVSEASRMIHRTMDQAGHLIQSFKLVAADQSYETIRVFDLGEYLSDVIKSFGSKFKKRNIEVVLEAEAIELLSYPGTFYQILSNLMLNSLTHGYEIKTSGKIHISIYEDKNRIHLHYEDDGDGMSQEVKEKIFEPFFTTKRTNGGTGLGLNIINNLVHQKLSGTIKCESKIGVGTKFYIEIPKEKS